MRSINSRWEQLDNLRSGKLVKARKFAQATIPSLLPPDIYSENANSSFKYPHSSLPARGVKEWSAKMTTSILPLTEEPFLAIELSPQLELTLEGSQIEEYDRYTRMIQDLIHQELAQSNAREIYNVALQHICVIGDILVHQKGLDFRYYRLDNYVVQRGSDGQPIEIIVRKFMYEKEVPSNLLEAVKKSPGTTIERSNETLYPYFIHLEFKDGKWVEKHYIGDVNLPDEDTSYIKEEFPYYALRYKHDQYENWSVSLVEENYGDILTAHATRETLLEALSINNMGFIGVVPGTLTPNILRSTPNWGVVPIRDANTIQMIQPNTINTITTSASFEESISSAIRRIFLMDIASELTHDRTTAYQIKQAMEALDRSSGGTLSSLKNEGLKRMARVTLNHLMKSNKLSPEIKELIKAGDLVINIKSGIDSISAATQEQNVLQFFAETIQLDPESIQEFDRAAMLRWRAKQRGIPLEILKSAQKKQEDRQAEIDSQITEQLVQGVGAAAQNVISQ